MLKQMIFVVLALWLTSHVEGKAIAERPALLPNSTWISAADTMPEFQIISLENEPDKLHQIIIPNRKPLDWNRPGTIIDHGITGPAFQNIFQMIQGRVPGVWVSGTNNNYQIRVRGALGPPLVVVDGMPFRSVSDQYLNTLLGAIPPADVAYIEVLKSIAQSAIYGPGAGNGVIVVHTKTGDLQEN